MKLRIHKNTTYSYESPVSFSPHLVRTFPRTDLSVRVDHFHFATNPDADISRRQDLFDNLVAHCFYHAPSETLVFTTTMELDLQEKNPFHFLLDTHALKIPVNYRDHELAILAPYLGDTAGSELPAPLAPAPPRPTVETLVTLNTWIHENIAYHPRPDGDPHHPSETLRLASGSCRDFAALLVEALRRNGVASRLASGFVWEGDKDPASHRATSAMHAWVEAYIPGPGWIGLDPTNGVLTDHHFITTAVGRLHREIAPITGAYYSDSPVAGHLETSVAVEKID
jgi:transglutaminase-like putative cysteine protease